MKKENLSFAVDFNQRIKFKNENTVFALKGATYPGPGQRTGEEDKNQLAVRAVKLKKAILIFRTENDYSGQRRNEMQD